MVGTSIIMFLDNYVPVYNHGYLVIVFNPSDSHSIFGRVSGGIDTVRRIGLVTTNEDEKYCLYMCIFVSLSQFVVLLCSI